MKKTIILLTLITILPVQTYAFSNPASLFRDMQKQQNINLDCFDFTGTWTGTCTQESSIRNIDIPNQDMDEQLKISQIGCNLIIINGNATGIGGIKTETMSIPIKYENLSSSVSSSVSQFAKWNKEKNKVHTVGTASIAALSESSTLVQMNIESDMFVDEGKLITDTQFRFHNENYIKIKCERTKNR